MKKERQEKIKEIVESYKIDTQDELIKRLKENGFSATQATMSRDIKELKLTKISDGKNGYYYVFPNTLNSNDINKLNASLMRLITSVNYAMNIVGKDTWAENATSTIQLTFQSTNSVTIATDKKGYVLYITAIEFIVDTAA